MTEILEGQTSIFDLDGQYGRTSPERSAPQEEKTSAPSSPRSRGSGKPMWIYLDLRAGGGPMPAGWREMGGASAGGHTMLSTGESPNVAVESTLSQILDLTAPQKYCLSPKACAGILRRADMRGKELPAMLREALEEKVFPFG